MKIAIFHDYLDAIGGGERLVLELARQLKADIITTDLNKKNVKKLGYPTDNIKSLGKNIQFPGLKQIHASIKFARTYQRKYNYFILSGNWAVFAAKKHQPNIYYIHTPVRMFYDSYEYFKSIAGWKKIPFIIWVKVHKYFVENGMKYANKIVANSENVKKRIKKYHGRAAKVIYPPIKKYKYIESKDFWISVNRIYPHKRIDLQIDIFRQLPGERLKIVGGHSKGDNAAGYAKKISTNLPKNVEMLGEVSEKELEQLYGTCKGLITTSRQEDFGMNALEAMSAGKPVLAVDEGGYKETVINGKTGHLIKKPYKENFVKIIKKFNENKIKKEDCQRHAEKFAAEKFVKKINEELKK